MATPQSKKKLVQGRLPFQVFRNSVNEETPKEDNLNLASDTGKKKRSDSYEENQPMKKPKLDESNIDCPESGEVIVSSDESTEEKNEDMDVEEPEEASTPCKKIMVRKITPKQLEKRKEAARRREEKNTLKQEKNLKKEEEKREKQKLKEEKELMKKRELDEKRKAKEEKERRKQEELDLKNEEKLRKEAEKRKKEEEDALNKKKFAKEAVVFTNFFTKVDPEKNKRGCESNNDSELSTGFKPFAVKNRMRLAPIFRNPLDDIRREVLENALNSQMVTELYITQLKKGLIRPKHSPNTWPLDEVYQEDEIEIEELLEKPVSNETQRPKNHHPKLLQFCENRRPPYWGTWRKCSPSVGPRRPLGRYQSFDYDIDSDEEWEEEEPGESLHGSDDEKEKEDVEEEDDYEVDNDVFVPHGYLSEDEAQPDEAWDVEQQKEKLKLLGEQFDNERNEKTKKLRPVVIGCIWLPLDDQSNKKLDALFLRCTPFANDTELPLAIETNDANLCMTDRENDASSPGANPRRGVFPEEAVPLLATRVHGSVVRRRGIAREFIAEWANQQQNPSILSLAAVSKKIRELAQWQSMNGRNCWVILPEFREKYGCVDLETSIRLDDSSIISPKITKFTKKMTEDERRSALKSRPTGDEAPEIQVMPMVEKTIQKLSQFRTNPAQTVKKRVAILHSAPLGVPISVTKLDDKEVQPPKENN